MWRQGDVLIREEEEIPEEVVTLKRLVLATGDSNGFRHQIKNRHEAKLYLDYEEQDLYLEVIAEEATIVHPEHDPIVLPRGRYSVWRQREYTDFGTRTIYD